MLLVQFESAALMGILCKIYVIPITVIDNLAMFRASLEEITLFNGMFSNLIYYIISVGKKTEM